MSSPALGREIATDASDPIGLDGIEVIACTATKPQALGEGVLPDDQRFGVMPKGRVLVGPGGPASRFDGQLIEPEPGIVDAEGKEWIARVGLGTPDPRACVAALRERGMAFAESAQVHADERGALTRMQLGSVVFELVRDAQQQGR